MQTSDWKLISLVSTVQVVSEAVFFAQGIFASNETNVKSSSQKELDWVRICVPLFYAATRQISEPCWRWILGGYGDRMTTILGIVTIMISVVAASCQEIVAGNVAYVILGGIGMGLVRLQLKSIKSNSGDNELPLWGAGISGIGLSLWPILASLCVRSLGSGYAMLIFAGITLHAVPFAMFAIRPVTEEQQADPETTKTVIASPSISPEISFTNSQEDYSLSYPLMYSNSYRIRPSYCVEVLPGIPEEVEHESDHERDHEMQRTIPKVGETVEMYSEEIAEREACVERDKRKRKSKRIRIKIPQAKIMSLNRHGMKPTEPFAYTLFVATILLRLGDQFCVTIIISLLPIFAGYLVPNLRLQEKAFLISLCGFAKILTEFPLIAIHMRSKKKTKVVFICGPIFAAIGLYLTWNSTTLDSITLASFGLGIGSGAASVTLQVLAPRESPGVCDAADVVIGFSLLAIISLARIFILGHVIQGCLLLAAAIYIVAAITSVFNLRKTA